MSGDQSTEPYRDFEQCFGSQFLFLFLTVCTVEDVVLADATGGGGAGAETGEEQRFFAGGGEKLDLEFDHMGWRWRGSCRCRVVCMRTAELSVHTAMVLNIKYVHVSVHVSMYL